MAEIRLFGAPISPFVDKTRRAIRLKGLALELVEPRRITEFRAWNPQTRKMPVAEIGGDRIYDSTFILRRLDEIAPEPPLFSADPQIAAGQRLLEDWSDESLYWLRMAILWSDPERAADVILDTMSIPGLLKPLARAGIKRQMTGAARAQGYGRLPREVLVRELGNRCDDLAAILTERPYFHDDSVSAADLAICAQLHFSGVAPPDEFPEAVDSRPALRVWKERVDKATAA